MEPRAISALEAVRTHLEEDLGLTDSLQDLVQFAEALEPREATRARLRAIAQRTQAAETGKKVEPREASRERFRAIAQRTGAAKSKRKLKPGEKMVFGKVVKAEAVEMLAGIRRKLELDLMGEAQLSKAGKVAFKALDMQLKRTKLSTSSGEDRIASADEFMLMNPTGQATGDPKKAWAFKHRKTRNYVYLDSMGKLWVPKTSKDFHKGTFDEANGAEQVACAASGALGLKKGQKGDKKRLAKEIAKRTKSKKLARKAAKMAQEF